MAGLLLCFSACTKSAKSGSEQNASLKTNQGARVEAPWFEDITEAAASPKVQVVIAAMTAVTASCTEVDCNVTSATVAAQ